MNKIWDIISYAILYVCIAVSTIGIDSNELKRKDLLNKLDMVFYSHSEKTKQTYRIQLDVNQIHPVESGFTFEQNEDGFDIEIEVLNFDTTGLSPSIVFKNASETFESQDISFSENKYTYTIKDHGFETLGTYICSLKLKNNQSKHISTFSFKFYVTSGGKTENKLTDMISFCEDKIILTNDNIIVKRACSLENPKDINTSPQGMSIYNGKLFILYHTGYYAIYDVSNNDTSSIPCLTAEASGQLGSFASTNHANNCQFGNKYSDKDIYPLLYVTNGMAGTKEMFCSVERYLGGTFRTVQNIYFDYDNIDIFQAPNFCVDSNNQFLYMFGAQKRTNKIIDYYKDENKNKFCIIKFKLPSISESTVTLTSDDIIEYIEYPYNITFMQSSTFAGNYIISTFGVGNSNFPSAIGFYDVIANNDTIVYLKDSVLKGEPEGVCLYNNSLYVVSGNGVYKIDF